jgi:predicted ATPase/DNA-binding SARP family transcriptional activator
MKIGVLGPLQLLGDDGAPVVLRSWRRRLLLAVLVAGRGHAVPIDVLAESLWLDGLPINPGAALQSQVSRLRRQLGPAGGWIETAASGYRFVGPAARLDRARFEQLLDRARGAGGEPAVALDVLDEALGLWRGRAFGDLADRPAVAGEAMHLEELRAEAAEQRAELLLELGRAAEAASAMRSLAGEQVFCERPVAILMRALAQDGRHAAALEEFDRFRRVLDDELGLVPSPALRAVQHAVLRHDGGSVLVPTIGLPGNSFVGRDAEVARVMWLLERSRLVTLTGPGGVGKTRLALHAATEAADRYPDGIFVCELAGVPNPGDVTAAVASTLQLDEQADRRLIDRVVEVLRPRQALLLLDNCEHVLTAVGELVTAILRSTPDIDVIATSRERLGVEGEQRMPVGPLAVPAWDDPDSASVALYRDRVRALHPDGELPAMEVATVSELCRHLDGLPLAIELAAAQTVWRSPSEILAAVSGHLRELSDRRRTVARHRSLEAVFGWSYDLLDPNERQVFEGLAVFAGGWTVAAAAAVAFATSETLRALVERSLVVATPSAREMRLTMLEPVRQYAQARLATRGTLEETRARHASWAVGFATAADAALRGPDETAWRAAVDTELANLRAAHRWCLDRRPEAAVSLVASLYRYCWCGAPSEVYSWAEEVVARNSGAGPPQLAAAYATATLGAWHRGDLPRARVLAEAGTTSADAEPGAARFAWEALGDVETFLGEFDAAVSSFGTALGLARAAEDDHQTAIVLLDRAMSHAYAGRVEQAIADADTAAPLVAAIGNPVLQAWSDYVNGEVRLEHAPHEALSYLRTSAAAARRLGSRLLIGVAGLSAASCEARIGQPDQALPQYAQLIEHWRHDGAWNMQWATLRTFIELLVRLGRHADAVVLHGAMRASATAPPLVGADTVRIAAAIDAARRRLGQERFEVLTAEGTALSDEEAVAFAMACVTARPG